jgi:predicted GNAT family acetyltransferase
MVAADVEGAHEAEVLTAADVPEVLDLVTRTKPGPFLPRTIEFGRYLGIRRNGRLVSMAGERMRGPGWTEISAVCTDDAYRGQGLAARVVRAVAAGIAGRGETALLHVDRKNSSAIRFYENLGFTVRAEMDFVLLEAGGGR